MVARYTLTALDDVAAQFAAPLPADAAPRFNIAPLQQALIRTADGIAAAAWVAFVFAFACPYNGSPYIAMLNAVGCGLVTVFARLVLSRLTPW